ncbi:MAG: mechanosensitive ion channel family protein [Pseudobdellovibrionaceae bacterium]
MNPTTAGRLVAGELNEWMTESLFLMPNWKWIGLVLAIVIGLLLKSVLKSVLRTVKNASWTHGRATGFLLHFLETDLQKPLAWILTCVFWLVSLHAIGLPEGPYKVLAIFIQIILAFHLIVLVYRAAEAFGALLVKITEKTGTSLDGQLAPMATKILKVLVVVLGVLITIQNFGVNVMSILAGLGLGGLALALAAQDTAANLFGSITIVADRPFRIGDYIKIGGTEGVVEEIGFRSTRIRTPYRSLVTIPNSVVAKEMIDNLEFRPERRVRHILGFTYNAKEAQLKSFMMEVASYLQNHPKVDQTRTTIRFFSLGDFSLQVQVQFYIYTTDANEEMEIQENFLFFVMQTAEKIGLDFAFPTQTQHVKLEQAPRESQSPHAAL